MSPPGFQPRRDLEARAAELERRLREVRRAIAAAERGRPVTPPRDLESARATPRAPERLASPAAAGSVPRLAKPTPTAPLPRAEPAAAGRRTSPVETDRERFAHYFGSAFLGRPPPSVERRLQRNRAIVMLIVVAILAYIVYSLAR